MDATFPLEDRLEDDDIEEILKEARRSKTKYGDKVGDSL